MMEKYEFSGKNLDQAITNGLKELNKKRDEVDIKIISTGGLFSKAKVEITVDNEKVDDIIEEIVEERKNEEKILENETKLVEKVEKISDEPKMSQKIEEKTEEKAQKAEETQNIENDKTAEVEKNITYLTSEEVFDEVQKIFKDIFKILDLDARIVVMEQEDAYQVKIVGDEEKIAKLIGFRGEGLNAYQYLINNLPTLKNKEKRILLDIENYRDKREESLRALARRTARNVLKTKRRFKFEPMNAYERRIIHDEIGKIDGVTTHSEGVEPHRCLIVEYV